jgi:predicted dehydrogenase
MQRTGVALVGCGYVADFYVRTLSRHPKLELVGVTDRDSERAARFSRHHGVPAYSSLDDLLDDPRAMIIVNLTNPASHFDVSRSAIEAGRHVYSEKPLAMDMTRARELVDLARRRERLIVSAPCSILGETAQTLWKALRERRVGKVRLVYAELDDGMVHRMPYRRWISEAGAPWPYRDEFRVGCTLEHAGYYVTWLTAFFGPAESVVALASCLVPDKTSDLSPEEVAPDFSLAVIRFASGVVARLTCSVVAPHDHSLRIVGDDGVLSTKDCWYYDSPVHIQRTLTIRRRAFLSPIKSRVRPVRRPRRFLTRAAAQMDFARGVAEMAEALVEGRLCRLSMEYCLHNTELVLAVHHASTIAMPYQLTTTFEAMEPMPWGR